MTIKPLDDGFNPVTLTKRMNRAELIEWLHKLSPSFTYEVTMTKDNRYDNGKLIAYWTQDVTITAKHTYPHD